jgi:hypothetical protein
MKKMKIYRQKHQKRQKRQKHQSAKTTIPFVMNKIAPIIH